MISESCEHHVILKKTIQNKRLYFFLRVVLFIVVFSYFEYVVFLDKNE